MSSKKINPLEFIPKPCKEDWHAMSGDEKRRHCEKCDTDVVDLTGMTADEIFGLRKQNGGKLCGAFRLSKPLALGTGIAALALASCENKGEVVVPGVICPPPAESDPTKECPKSPTPEKPATKSTGEKGKVKAAEPKRLEIEVPMLMGDICMPPDQLPKPDHGPA